MTTIVYDKQKQTLSVDSRITDFSIGLCEDFHNKLIYFGDVSLTACGDQIQWATACGDCNQIEKFYNALQTHQSVEAVLVYYGRALVEPELEVYMLAKSGKLYTCSPKEIGNPTNNLIDSHVLRLYEVTVKPGFRYIVAGTGLSYANFSFRLIGDSCVIDGEQLLHVLARVDRYTGGPVRTGSSYSSKIKITSTLNAKTKRLLKANYDKLFS